MKHVCNSKKALTLWITLVLCTAMAIPARAMHIMEGYLPAGWCIPWALLCLPFLAAGLRSIARQVKEDPQAGVMLAMAGAFAFILSALKIPSVTGSSSHMTGLGFAAILFGPATASVLGLIVLLFQALLLAHGGLTTLGANTFSMGVAGPLAAWGVYTLLKKAGWGEKKFPLFLAAALGDLLTYVVTSVQLGLAHPDQYGGMGVSILKFMAIFAPTQVPLAIVEGILTVVLVGVITAYTKDTASAGNGGLGHE